MATIKSSSELKAIARDQLAGNYKTTVLSFVVFYLLSIVASDIVSIAADTNSTTGILLYLIISLIVSVFLCVFAIGFAQMYLKLSLKKEFRVSDIFYGFKNNLNHYITISAFFILGTYFPYLIGTIIYNTADQIETPISCFLAYLIASAFFIFAIVMLLRYGLVFFITLDFPQYDVAKVFKMSAYLMKGNRCRLFYILLSFLPLYILSFFTLPIGTVFTFGFFWIAPYMCATFANFYLNLVKSKTY